MAHLVFALIYNGVVANLAVGEYSACDAAAKSSYGDSAFAVDATQYPVHIGDIYQDGYFKQDIDGTMVVIEPIPTEADQIAALKLENAAIHEELDAVSLAVLDIIGGVE